MFWPELRVTLDDKGDYLLIKNIIENIGEDYHVNDVVKYVRENISLLNLNKDARVVDAPFQKLTKNNE